MVPENEKLVRGKSRKRQGMLKMKFCSLGPLEPLGPEFLVSCYFLIQNSFRKFLEPIHRYVSNK